MGVVYLAEHTTLERPAAIKFLSPSLLQDADYVQRFYREARMAAHLDHPHIVGIYDAGKFDNRPYLVMEFVEGQDLRQRLERETRLDIKLTVILLRQAASALAYAHKQGMVHRDIKPANMLLGGNDQLKIADLGLAKFRGDPDGEQTQNGGIVGTPHYMPPELIRNPKLLDARCDIYALGATAYRVVSGSTPYRGSIASEIISQRLAAPPPPLKSVTTGVDPRFCEIVDRMMEGMPERRFQSMEEIEETLVQWESGKFKESSAIQVSSDAPPPPQDVLELLNKRMSGRPDLPSRSATINRIVAISENRSVDDLTNLILGDFGLTNKILRLVNTVYYNAYVGRVSTISRAILVLGIEQIKGIALSLLLFESLQDKNTADEVRSACARSFVAGQISRDIARQAGFANLEEAFVCSAFHNLGKVLASFYLAEFHTRIRQLVELQGLHWEEAASKVLGMSFEQLGIRIAEQWQLPAQVIHAMKCLPPGTVPPPENEADQLRAIACFSGELCTVVESAGFDSEHAQAACAEIALRYEQCLPVSSASVIKTIKTSAEEVQQVARKLNIPLGDNPLLNKVRNFSNVVEGKPPVVPPPAAVYPGPVASMAAAAKSVSPADNLPSSLIVEPVTPSGAQEKTHVPAGVSAMDDMFLPATEEPLMDPDRILEQGIQDVTHCLTEDSPMNDILRMILEVIFRAMNFHQVIFCIKNMSTLQIEGRYGLGPDVQSVLPSFKFLLGGKEDIFNFALSEGSDLIVPDIKDKKVENFIPPWYARMISAQTFVVLPLLIRQTPIGLIYMDKLKADGIVITPARLNHMRTLRNQGILAIRKK